MLLQHTAIIERIAVSDSKPPGDAWEGDFPDRVGLLGRAQVAKVESWDYQIETIDIGSFMMYIGSASSTKCRTRSVTALRGGDCIPYTLRWYFFASPDLL